MRFHIVYPILLCVIFLIPLSSFSDPLSEKLVKSADTHRGLQDSFSMQVKTIVIDGTEKSEQVFDVKVKDPKTSLVEQVEPERAKGRKLLMKEFDMWLLTPQVKKAIRISMQQKLTGEVANGDIARTNYSEDYVAKTLGKEKKAIIIQLTAKDERVTYHMIKYWVDEKSAKPQKAEFYALSGKLLKTATFSNFKKIEGVERMTKVTIESAVSKSKKSVLIYSRQKSATFDSSLFNKEQMDR